MKNNFNNEINPYISRKLQLLAQKTEREINKRDGYEEYYYQNGILYEHFMQEHDKGHRPIEHIEKSYFKELNLNVSMRFFKWYLKKYCTTCNCEKDDIYDEKVMKLDFYDIVACSEQLKKQDIDKLKLEYSKDTKKEKSQKNMSDEYFYAKIEHFISPTRLEKKRLESYAIVYRDWAYIKPSGTNHKVKLKAEPKEYDAKILNKYFRRPDEMSKTVTNNIINKLLKSNPNLKLEKPQKKK